MVNNVTMKFTAILLFNLFVFAVSDEETEISTTHSEPTTESNGKSSILKQKTMRECCKKPYLSLSALYLPCRGKSSLSESEEIECFAKKIMKNGTIDKKKVVESLGHAFLWEKQIKSAVAICEYSSNGTLNENLASYFDCLNGIFEDNCVEFFPYVACIATQEQFLRQKFVYENCTEWPRDLKNPTVCCDTPTLYSANFQCELKCRKTEFLHSEKRHCQENCALEAEGIVTQDGKIDFVAVRRILLEKTQNTSNYDLVDGVAGDCENVLKDKPATAVVLEKCLRKEFSQKCVNFGGTYECGLVKNFMKQCPNVKPQL